MKILFELEDIHEFFRLRYGLDWQYEIYDKYLGDIRKAKIEDFCDSIGFVDHTYVVLVNKHGKNCILEVNVSDYKFITYKKEANENESGSTTQIDKDLSKFWIEYMLEAYGEVYGKKLFKYCAKNKKRIEEAVARKINDYSNKVKQESRKEIKYYENLADKAMEHMLDSDIAELKGTI